MLVVLFSLPIDAFVWREYRNCSSSCPYALDVGSCVNQPLAGFTAAWVGLRDRCERRFVCLKHCAVPTACGHSPQETLTLHEFVLGPEACECKMSRLMLEEARIEHILRVPMVQTGWLVVCG